MDLNTEDQLHRIAEDAGIVEVLKALSRELQDAGIAVFVPTIFRGRG